jgi:protein-disulfide isomerase
MADSLTPPLGPEDHVTGLPDAPVTLVQYGDYQCPHCRLAYAVLHEVLLELGDSVRFAFRHFPITDSHPYAMMAAEAAESVAALGGELAFWEMHAILFENQDALQIDDLLGYAAAIGVDAEDVADDLAHGTRRKRVRADADSGLRSGVTGTPTFFINGRRFHGDWSDADALTAALRLAARQSALH